MALNLRTACLLLAISLLALGAHAAHITSTSTARSSDDKALTTHSNETKKETTQVAATKAAVDDAANHDDNDDDSDEEDAASAEKSELQAGVDESSLSIWSMVRGLWGWIREDLRESLLGDDAEVAGRTFGKIRRLQMALIPIVFKFGILSAMVTFLVLLGIKTVFLLKLLLLMNAAALLGKFLTLKTNFGHVEQHSAPTWGYSSWSPAVSSSGGWASDHAPAHPSKEIHLHIHGAQAQVQPQVGHSQGWERRSDPYSAYEPSADAELNNAGPFAAGYQSTSFPANHRRF